MTVPAGAARVSYSIDGTAYSVPFYFLQDEDLRVLLRAANGTETEATLGVDYTVSGAENPAGGTVTFGAEPSGVTVVIIRDPDIEQPTDYPEGGRFPSASHERALDRVTMIAQRLDDRLGRALVIDETDPNPPPSPTVIATVAGIEGEVETLAGLSAEITALNGISADITTVAGVGADVAALGPISADISALAGISSDVTTLAGVSADVATLAPIAGNVTTVAGISADVTGVNSISANVTTVAGISADVTSVAGVSAGVTTVAGISTDVTAVAANGADVSTVAENIGAVQEVKDALDASIASGISYANATSGLTATEVQGAIDEVNTKANENATAISGLITGKILQVKQVVHADVFVSTATGWVDVPDLSVAITPSSVTSKILIIASLSLTANSTRATVLGRIMRNTTPIGLGGGAVNAIPATFASAWTDNNVMNDNPKSFTLLDSPSTVDEITYKIQANKNAATGFTIGLNDNRDPASETGNIPSSIIIMEVGE